MVQVTKIRKDKKDLVGSLSEKFKKAKAVVFADYKGLSANQMNVLRGQLQETKSEAQIAKNTLLKVAMAKNAIETSNFEKDLKGSTVAIFSYEDTLTDIKSLFKFINQNELPKVKSGLFDGVYTPAKDLEALSTLPSKEELLTKILIQMKMPITGFVGVIGGVNRKLVYALNAVAIKKGVE